MNEVHRFPDPIPAPGAEGLLPTVASRICHDLISPLGAIANGVELIGLAGLPSSPELDLIRESVDSANARIRFFRLAYGAASDGQRVGRGEVTATLRAVSRGGRLSYDWEVTGDQPRAEVRAVFLLLQCFETAMPMGGHVAIRRHGEAWEVTGEGTRMRVDDALWAALCAPRARRPDSAALVQFALLPAALAGLGRALTVEAAADRLTARF